MSGTKLPIVEIFESFQGEGFHTGTLVCFVRFSGCNLNCHFCDTDHSVFNNMSIQEIMDDLSRYKSKDVILTGGEVTIHPYKELVSALRDRDYNVMLETNGTGKIQQFEFNWVATSPKRDSNWVYDFINTNELKIVVDEQLTTSEVAQFIDFPGRKYLQPESNSEKMVKKAMGIIHIFPQFRISMQMQKIWDVR